MEPGWNHPRDEKWQQWAWRAVLASSRCVAMRTIIPSWPTRTMHARGGMMIPRKKQSMMRRVLLGSLIGMVLISCSPTPAQIPVNLEHVDLEQLVLQPDDFPPNTLMGTLTGPYNVPIHGRDPQIVK